MSNLLSGSRAYLAGNLEYTEDNFEHGWRQRIGGELRKLSVTVLDPSKQTKKEKSLNDYAEKVSLMR